MSLTVGDQPPSFALHDHLGDRVALDDYAGWRLVWWIPSTMAEMTPPCSDQIAQGFTTHDDPRLTVFGMSFDERRLLAEFVRRSAITFPMLSADKETGQVWGVYRGDEDEWNCFPRKRAFLLDPHGRIAKVYLNIDPDLFVHEVIADLDELAPRKTSLLERVLTTLKG